LTATWRPVVFRPTPESEATIGSPEEALGFMDQNQKLTQGDLFGWARKHCLACAEDPTALPKAELAFRAAINTLGMFPEARRRPPRDKTSEPETT